MNTRLLLALFAYRLCNSFFVKTFFQPDEFYQALEPAHNLIYGYGYITWEWHEALRSLVHPLLYALAYGYLRALFPKYEDITVIVAPKVVGAAVAAVAELYTYKFALHYTGSFQIAQMTLYLSLLSPWNWFFITRAFSNNLEMCLTAVGLSLWPWHRGGLGHGTFLKACTFGFLSCILRPSNAVLWMFLGVSYLGNVSSPSDLVDLGFLLTFVFAAVSVLVAIPDSLYYGQFIYPPYQFLKFNVFKNLLIFYGSAPWHFYLFQALPLLLMGYLPFVAYSMWRNRRTILVPMVLVVVLAFSCIAHKEFRFIYPLYPVFLLLAAQQMRRMWGWRHRNQLLSAVLVAHVIVAFFFTRVHERGEIDVVQYLKYEPEVTSVGLLTPCHSVPWHSVLHRPELAEHLWMITCEPPLHLEKGNLAAVQCYRDELDRFYDDPEGFLQENLPKKSKSGKYWPSHLVFYEHIEPVVADYLSGTGYHECRRFFNSFFHWDPRRHGDIVVYCKS